MARRTKVYSVDDKNSRDHGKSYLITEMPEDQAEWWAFRVLQALMGANAEMTMDVPLAHLARQGFAALAKVPPEQAKPLLDEMMLCVSIPLPGNAGSRERLPSDIEEVKTRVLLRKEILELHIGFFGLGGE